MPNSPLELAEDCYHCGLPIPQHFNLTVDISGEPQSMCCPGCQAVALSIVDGGLENFYRFRSEHAQRPKQAAEHQWQVYDLAEVQTDFVTHLEGGEREAQLLIQGITCAACVWLLEKQLGALPGVTAVTVNASTHRCLVRWSSDAQTLSHIMSECQRIGYESSPASDEQAFQLRKKENRQALMRLGVAGIGMMQIGMVAIALYAGAAQGISEGMQSLLRYLSLVIATPVVFYSARPFFQAARRSLARAHLKHLNMDVPVSFAIIAAYLASVYSTLTNTGEVYFDSVSMFTFFLLLGRYLEMRVRHANSLAMGNLSQLLPFTANRLGEPELQPVAVPLRSLVIGDRVLVRAGEVFPCDGCVLQGSSSVEEALLTGEAKPLRKNIGDAVIAGTLNTESALEVRVTGLGENTTLSAIDKLATRAELEKPQQQTLADKVAAYFVAAVLVLTALVGTFWYLHEPAQAFWIVLSILVVTCPCALSLATPLALAAATSAARRQGFLITRAHVLESLANITRLVFDKTGTLTLGQLRVKRCVPIQTQYNERHYLALAAALEKNANHPIASAFLVEPATSFTASNLHQYTAEGVGGQINKLRYRLGSVEFVCKIFPDNIQPSFNALVPDEKLQWLLLGSELGPLAWFGLSDSVRDGAGPLLSYCNVEAIQTELLSGDASPAVAALAKDLGIQEFQAGAKPADKLERIHRLQALGERVLMMGDGINDVPVLAGADVSIAMGAATDLAQTRADAILLNNDLSAVARVRNIALKTRKIIRQNVTWALCYNALALPLAALGMVPPWAAAIGMSASSLVVTLNALRLNR